MKRSFVSLLVIAVAMLASAVAAQTGSATPSSDQSTAYVSGTVVSSTGSSILIKTVSGDELTFSVDSRSILPGDLPVGAQVDVSYHTLPDGMLHAAEVRRLSTTGAAARQPGDGSLPQTASPLAMTALVGLVSLVVASGIWLLVGRRYA